jgi:hypothetical protein
MPFFTQNNFSYYKYNVCGSDEWLDVYTLEVYLVYRWGSVNYGTEFCCTVALLMKWWDVIYSMHLAVVVEVWISVLFFRKVITE